MLVFVDFREKSVNKVLGEKYVLCEKSIILFLF